jgi:hypothetical protein
MDLEGVHTIRSVMAVLGVRRNRAVYFIHRLRKEGYVRTHKRSDQTRVYFISFQNKLGGRSYYDIINQYSPVKISPPSVQNVYGREPTIEETLVFALKTRSVRTILAALALFRRVRDWLALYALAKRNGLERQVGAIHGLARLVLKSIPRLPARYERYALPKKEDNMLFVVENLKSKDFLELQKKWKVWLPFNKADLEDYLDFH